VHICAVVGEKYQQEGGGGGVKEKVVNYLFLGKQAVFSYSTKTNDKKS